MKKTNPKEEKKQLELIYKSDGSLYIPFTKEEISKLRKFGYVLVPNTNYVVNSDLTTINKQILFEYTFSIGKLDATETPESTYSTVISKTMRYTFKKSYGHTRQYTTFYEVIEDLS